MRRYIEYNNKELVINRLKAITSGNKKLSDFHIRFSEKYYGIVNEEGFVLQGKKTMMILIQGRFIDSENMVELDIVYNNIKHYLFTIFNCLTLFLIVIQLILHNFLCAIVLGLFILFFNPYLLFVFRVIANMHYEVMYTLITFENSL